MKNYFSFMSSSGKIHWYNLDNIADLFFNHIPEPDGRYKVQFTFSNGRETIYKLREPDFKNLEAKLKS